MFWRASSFPPPTPPRVAILSFSPFHCVFTDSFWNHSVKYGYLDWTEIEEMRAYSRQFKNDRPDWTGKYDDSQPLFGPETIGDIDARLKIGLYSIRFPSYYFPSLIAGGFLLRGPHNLDVYRETRKTAGHRGYGILNGTKELSQETQFPVFTPSPLFDRYLSATVALFQQKNIPVYFIATPINEVTAAALHPGISTDYVKYIGSYETRYPNFHRIGDPLPTFPWTDFGDINHLNPKGALVFSSQVAALLREEKIEK